jgi:uncharacterized membrane protein YqjE
MNPMMLELLGAILRYVAGFLLGVMLSHGVITDEQSTRFLNEIAAPTTVLWVIGMLPLVWSMWQKFRSRQKLLTALASPTTTTEDKIQKTVDLGLAPSITTPKSEVPTLKAPPPPPFT